MPTTTSSQYWASTSSLRSLSVDERIVRLGDSPGHERSVRGTFRNDEFPVTRSQVVTCIRGHAVLSVGSNQKFHHHPPIPRKERRRRYQQSSQRSPRIPADRLRRVSLGRRCQPDLEHRQGITISSPYGIESLYPAKTKSCPPAKALQAAAPSPPRCPDRFSKTVQP